MNNLEWFRKNHGNKKFSGCAVCKKIRNVKCCGDITNCPTYNEFFDWLMQEHKEPIEFTEDEKVILRNIDKDYKWIARDEDGNLHFYTEKPLKRTRCWIFYNGGCLRLNLFHDLFKCIQWADDEPINFREVLENEQTK